MNAIKDALLSGNLVAWGIAVVALIVVVQVIKSIGKGLFIFGGVVLVVFLFSKYFPSFAEPLVDFIGGSWLDN